MHISASTSITRKPTTSTNKILKKHTPHPKFINEFAGLEDLCDLNECYYWIDKQNKENKMMQNKVIKYKIAQSMAVILCKDETNMARVG